MEMSGKFHGVTAPGVHSIGCWMEAATQKIVIIVPSEKWTPVVQLVALI
jgi:hypothetical protein